MCSSDLPYDELGDEANYRIFELTKDDGTVQFLHVLTEWSPETQDVTSYEFSDRPLSIDELKSGDR